LIDAQGVGAAVPLLERFIATNPRHAGAQALLGDHLASLSDPRGEALLLRVVELHDQQWTPLAFQALERHYQATGELQRAREMRSRLDAFETDVQAAARERFSVTSRDTVQAVVLPGETLERLRSDLQTHNCGAAWLAEKQMQYFPERRLFILSVSAGGGLWPFGRSARDQRLAALLSAVVQLPGQCLVVGQRGAHARLARKVARVVGSEIVL
jgi:hypothetical protein